MNEYCDAGRSAGFGGKWRTPCPDKAMHYITSPALPPIKLCDRHFQEVAAAGLVKDQNIGPEEYDRREQERQEKTEEE